MNPCLERWIHIRILYVNQNKNIQKPPAHCLLLMLRINQDYINVEIKKNKTKRKKDTLTRGNLASDAISLRVHRK